MDNQHGKKLPSEVLPTVTDDNYVIVEMPDRSVCCVDSDGSRRLDDIYGVSATGASVAAKTVACKGFSLIAGARITVKFTYANTVNSPTLNVNSTGAKSIKADGDTTYVKWLAGAVMEFVYDGSYWVVESGYQLAGMRVGKVYTSTNATSPATLYGGTWTQKTGAGQIETIDHYEASVSVSAGTTGTLKSVQIPANCFAVITGNIESNSSNDITMSATLTGIGNSITARTIATGGGGCSVSKVEAPRDSAYYISIQTYNYASVPTTFRYSLSILLIYKKNIWERTA